MPEQSTKPLEDGNGNVTRLQIKNLQDDVDALCEWRSNFVDSRPVTRAEWDKLMEKLDRMNDTVLTLRERLSILSIIELVFTTIVGAVAAWLGRR